jgi:hypothetical protein
MPDFKANLTEFGQRVYSPNNPPPVGGGGAGVSALDFGAFPGSTDAVAVITGQVGITADSKVEAWIRPYQTNYWDKIATDTPAPISWWPLGESAGPTAVDRMGLNPGTYHGSPTLGVPGSIAGAADTGYTGATGSDYVLVPDSASLDVGASISIEAIIKTSALGASGGSAEMIAAKGGQGAVWLQESGGFFYLRNGKEDFTSDAQTSADSAAEALAVLKPSTWYHLVSTIGLPATGSTRLYLNGVDVTNVNSNNVTPVSNAVDLKIGGLVGSNPWLGVLQHVAYYGVIMSPAQVAKHYAWAFGVCPECHSPDEHVVNAPRVVTDTIVPGVGFTIHGVSPDLGGGLEEHRRSGRYTVAWRWT